MLSANQIDQFVQRGFIQLSNVVPAETCAEIRNILWSKTGLNKLDRTSWSEPVVRLGEFHDEPFRTAANMPQLLDAFDQLVGENRWQPRMSLGSFPIRFPSEAEPGDCGWHVDASFPGDDVNDFMNWRINVHSRNRALLMLFLFSEVGVNDAPTRILVGSHLQVARMLAPHGQAGLPFMELGSRLSELSNLQEVHAIGPEGTVYLCHPFLAHAAQAHRGTEPRFMAQPPLTLKEPYELKVDGSRNPPVEYAIIKALSN